MWRKNSILTDTILTVFLHRFSFRVDFVLYVTSQQASGLLCGSGGDSEDDDDDDDDMLCQ